MKFADFICPGAIRAALTADDKEGVIREMVEALLEAGEIPQDQVESIVRAILNREELGSTGIGRGVAVPHTKHSSVDDLTGTVGVSKEGVDFNSLDGEKVYVFFLLISPPDRPGDHLRALENISRQPPERPLLPIPQAVEVARRDQPVAGGSGRQPVWTLEPCLTPTATSGRRAFSMRSIGQVRFAPVETCLLPASSDDGMPPRPMRILECESRP